MRQINLPMPLMVASVLVLASCGSDSAVAPGSDSGELSAPVQEANGSASSGNAVPAISARTYTGGSIHVKVSGFFEVDGSQELYKPASLTADNHTWLQYGNSDMPGVDVTVTSNESESGVSIGNGPYQVVGGTDDCKITFDVTPSLVSGHFSCADVTGRNQNSGQMGKVNVELTFHAKS